MDLEVIETGNGGDLVKNPKDLSVIDGFQNMPYLAMFGGSPGFPTPVDRPENSQAFDWWGNSLLLNDNQSVQFNSLTEEILTKVALNSSGAARIEQAIKDDLDFMTEFANVDVSVSIISDDKVAIGIVLIEPDNEQNKAFIFIWDATNEELSAVPDEGGGNIIKLFVKTPEGNFILTPEADKLLFI
jgi:hypothetical protein